MLRGINRYVIEINDPNNRCFEKVILFVKPEYNEGDYSKLKKEGEKIINTAELCGTNRQFSREKNNIFNRILSILIGMALGALITAIIIVI